MLDINLEAYYKRMIDCLSRDRVDFHQYGDGEDIRIDISKIAYIFPHYSDGEKYVCVGINGKEIVLNYDYIEFKRKYFQTRC